MASLLDTIKRWQLTKKGLSTGKVRRRHDEGSFVHSLDESIILRVGIIAGFPLLIIALNLQLLAQDRSGAEAFHSISQLFLVILALTTVFLLNHQGLLLKSRLLALTFGGLLIQATLGLLASAFTQFSGLSPHYALLITPYALAPMIHSVLLGRWLGIFTAVFMAILLGLSAPENAGKDTMVLALTTGLTAVYFTRNLKRRSQLLTAGLFSGLVGLACAWVLEVIPIRSESGVLDSQEALVQSASILGIGVITGLFVGGLLPALEGLFKITTNITWLEMSDLNHKLLRKMQLEAPGTFHHSMVVATLAEAAAENIGANATMCRVCAYFHDIGKIEKPEYFIENQGEENPHDSLTPNMSALVIIAHVKDGIDLALRHKLNQAIINVIKEHHGNSLVYYFYRKAQEMREKALEEVKEGLRNEEDVPEISAKGFRYPGPPPRTKESSIISLADSVESASRSVKKVTPQKIQSMIDDIVNNRIRDGQLRECPLTFQELDIIKETFSKTLRSMLHSRIQYPKENGKESKERGEEVKPASNTEKKTLESAFSSPRTLASEERETP